MTDLLQTGSDWLADRMKAHASRSVSYHRDGDLVAVQAVVGQTVFETDNGYGAVEKFESRDFLILTADLVLGGATSR